MKKLRHIVVFKLHEGLEARPLIEILTTLANGTPQLLEWTVAQSLDTRKGILVIENFLFKSEDDLKEFKNSKIHQETSLVVREMADWQVIDYWE